jgi:hypothetical protein
MTLHEALEGARQMSKTIRNVVLAALAVTIVLGLGATTYFHGNSPTESSQDQGKPSVDILELTLKNKVLPVQQIEGLI